MMPHLPSREILQVIPILQGFSKLSPKLTKLTWKSTRDAGTSKFSIWYELGSYGKIWHVEDKSDGWRTDRGKAEAVGAPSLDGLGALIVTPAIAAPWSNIQGGQIVPRSNGILLRALQGGVGPWDHKVGLIIATGFDGLWPPLSSTSSVTMMVLIWSCIFLLYINMCIIVYLFFS